MPRATIDINETTRLDLKSCPEGFVVLKRMSYGKFLQRQQLALQMKVANRTKGGGDNSFGSIDMANRKVTEFEFKECIVDHNLENHDGSPLDFKSPYTLDMLDPRIGNEIGDEINRLHNFAEDEEALGNFQNGSSPSSSDGPVKNLTQT